MKKSVWARGYIWLCVFSVPLAYLVGKVFWLFTHLTIPDTLLPFTICLNVLALILSQADRQSRPAEKGDEAQCAETHETLKQ